jgi:hypothetical protein
MVRVKSTAQLRDDALASADEGHNNTDLAKRTESVRVSDASSQSHVKGESNGGSRTHSYYFGPSTLTVSHIREMMDQGYFAECGARVPGEETILEPESNEAVVFVDFFTTRLRMPPHPVLSCILLKF